VPDRAAQPDPELFAENAALAPPDAERFVRRRAEEQPAGGESDSRDLALVADAAGRYLLAVEVHERQFAALGPHEGEAFVGGQRDDELGRTGHHHRSFRLETRQAQGEEAQGAVARSDREAFRADGHAVQAGPAREGFPEDVLPAQARDRFVSLEAQQFIPLGQPGSSIGPKGEPAGQRTRCLPTLCKN